jgi:hypothetical protein
MKGKYQEGIPVDMFQGHPFVAVSDTELKSGPPITKGDIILHQHTDGSWEEAVVGYGTLTNARTGEKRESGMICFYTLSNGQSYLAGIEGRMLTRDTLKLKPKE